MKTSVEVSKQFVADLKKLLIVIQDIKTSKELEDAYRSIIKQEPLFIDTDVPFDMHKEALQQAIISRISIMENVNPN